MELLSLIMEGSIFICEKNHVFIEEDNPSSKVVTIEEGIWDIWDYKIFEINFSFHVK